MEWWRPPPPPRRSIEEAVRVADGRGENGCELSEVERESRDVVEEAGEVALGSEAMGLEGCGDFEISRRRGRRW